MTIDETARRQSITHVANASAREWPRKLVEAWADALRPYPADQVDEACRRAVREWDDTLIMPVAHVIAIIRAERRARRRTDPDDEWMRPHRCDCTTGLLPDTPPGHTYCQIHNVSWPMQQAAA